MNTTNKSLTNELPVYLESYDLLKYLMKLIVGLPRDIKFIYGMDLKDNAFALVANIYFANILKEQRALYINKSIANLKFINLMIRLSRDLNYIKDNQYVFVIKLSGSINKQLHGWKSTYIQ